MNSSLFIGMLLGLLVGLVLAVAVWLVYRARMAQAVAMERGLAESGRSVAEERQSVAARQTAQLERDLAELRRSLQEQTTRSAGAEARLPRIAELEEALKQRDSQILSLQAEISEVRQRFAETITQAEADRKSAAEKLEFLEQARIRLLDTFQALSSESLQKNNQAFLELAKENLAKFQESAKGDLSQRQQAIDELVKPLRESLEKVNQQIEHVEKERLTAYSGLTEQVRSLATSQEKLQSETGKLVTALRSPHIRGRWGEIQLKRVVELAGMIDRCDFFEQQSTGTETGLLRPDMIIRLPGNKTIVIDAKTSLDAYLRALEAENDADRKVHMENHARQVRAKVDQLSQKAYWNQFPSAPEFVVLFVPGEPFFSAALDNDPGLIEYGVDKRVIIATPTTLIALLKAVSYGWQQENLAKNAEEISRLGKELFERVAKLAEHFVRLGKSLDGATKSYNEAVGTLEGRVLPSARRFKDLSISSKEEIVMLEENTSVARDLQAPELQSLPMPEEESSES